MVVDLTRQLGPYMVLMAITMLEMNGIDATRAMHAEWPQVFIIGLSLGCYGRARRISNFLSGASVKDQSAGDTLVGRSLSFLSGLGLLLVLHRPADGTVHRFVGAIDPLSCGAIELPAAPHMKGLP